MHLSVVAKILRLWHTINYMEVLQHASEDEKSPVARLGDSYRGPSTVSWLLFVGSLLAPFWRRVQLLKSQGLLYSQHCPLHMGRH